MSDSREQFEAWVLSQWPKAPLFKQNGGDYRSETVQQSWAAWQASRQALVVEPSHRCPHCQDKLCGGTGVFTHYGQNRPCDGIPF